MFEVKIKYTGADKILQRIGLTHNGKAQRFFSSEVLRISNPYLPFRAGALQASGRVDDGGESVSYNTPYARYHWYGKLMVDPITKKGAFHNPMTGRYWSRPNVQKELTDRDLKYNGAPMRGARWTERAWIDHGKEVCVGVEKYIEGQK